MNQPNLTKICGICGQQKPLSAFLELTGKEGAHYGIICSTCRKTQMEQTKLKKEPDESTTSSTGHRIDLKAKVQAEIDKRQLRKEKKDSDELDREKQKREGVTVT